MNNISIGSMDKVTFKVLWAAMCSMVLDVHAQRDNLTEEEWSHAQIVFKELDEEMNANPDAP